MMKGMELQDFIGKRVILVLTEDADGPMEDDPELAPEGIDLSKDEWDCEIVDVKDGEVWFRPFLDDELWEEEEYILFMAVEDVAEVRDPEGDVLCVFSHSDDDENEDDGDDESAPFDDDGYDDDDDDDDD